MVLYTKGVGGINGVIDA